MQYWLMKSEPGEFSIGDLVKRPNKTEHWDGVRNYQARNFMRDDMKKGDQIFFYHSNCSEPGIVGIARVAREGYPDFTAFDPKDKHYDPKSKKDKPTWFMVDVLYVKRFKRTVTLVELKNEKKLKDMRLVQRGNRLSIIPITEKEWDTILKMEKSISA
ncbi:MAG: EVE domain-containing protein [Gammaproteobacteria bacterium]|nr:MAG: EVE domain-containing protein [Gammaproteobacteria bacterium]